MGNEKYLPKEEHRDIRKHLGMKTGLEPTLQPEKDVPSPKDEHYAQVDSFEENMVQVNKTTLGLELEINNEIGKNLKSKTLIGYIHTYHSWGEVDPEKFNSFELKNKAAFLADTYVLALEYHHQGYGDKAKEICKEILELNPVGSLITYKGLAKNLLEIEK